MSKVKIEILNHPEANRKKVDRLVKNHASLLMAAVDLQRASGRPPQAFLLKDGCWLSVCSRASAMDQGYPMSKHAEYLFSGIPDGCEMADDIRDFLVKDPTCLGTNWSALNATASRSTPSCADTFQAKRKSNLRKG